MNYLYESPEQLKEFGKAGRKASFHFSRELMAKKMMSVFNLTKNIVLDNNDPRKTVEKIVRLQAFSNVDKK